jgi:hypothetical protein
VSTLGVLFLLLVVAYLGGFLMGDRRARGAGLPSGSEWLVLGALLGPAALGQVDASTVDSLSPVATVAVAWIALFIGIHYGADRGRPLPGAGIALGLASGLLGILLVGGAVWIALERIPSAAAAFPVAGDRRLVALGVGIALSDTTGRSMRWAARRLGARGPVSDRLADVALSDDAVPLLATGLVLGIGALGGSPALPGAGLAIGASLGILAALLLGRRLGDAASWGLLFGVSLVAAGLAVQLDVSVAAALFILGLVLSVASPVRARLREMAPPVEGPILITVLFVGGFHLRLGEPAVLLPVAGVALAARLASKALSGLLVAAATPAARRAGPALGLSLFACGPLTVALGLAFQLHHPGPVGDTVLAVAAAAAVAGEFLGPPALRRALARAGELPAGAETEDEAAEGAR